jgi:hypothetical protein
MHPVETLDIGSLGDACGRAEGGPRVHTLPRQLDSAIKGFAHQEASRVRTTDIVRLRLASVAVGFQPRFPEGLEGPNGHGLGHGKEGRRPARACQHRQERLPGVLGFVAPCHEDVFKP